MLAKYSATSIVTTLLNATSDSLLFLPRTDVELEYMNLREHHRTIRDSHAALKVLLAMQLSPSFSRSEPSNISFDDEDLPPGFKVKGTQAKRKHARKESRAKQMIDDTPLKSVCPFIPTTREEVDSLGENLLIEQKKILEVGSIIPMNSLNKMLTVTSSTSWAYFVCQTSPPYSRIFFYRP